MPVFRVASCGYFAPLIKFDFWRLCAGPNRGRTGGGPQPVSQLLHRVLDRLGPWGGLSTPGSLRRENTSGKI